VIIIAATAVVVLIAVFTVALARAAGQADRDTAELLAEGWPELRDSSIAEGYPGFASAHATISREPSTTVPSSSTSVGTQRLPVSS
jgi:hypothetical protein